MDALAVDFKSLAAGERPDPEPEQPPAPATAAPLPLPERWQVLAVLDRALSRCESGAEAWDAQAARLRDQAAAADQRTKDAGKLRSDEAYAKRKVQEYREEALEIQAARRWVVHHGDTEARST